MPSIAKNMELGIRNLVFQNKKRSEYADKCFKEVLKENPDDIEALYYLASIHKVLKNFEVAMQYAEKILTINPKSVIGLTAKARVYEAQGLEDKFKDILSKVIQKIEGNNDYLSLHVIGVAFRDLNQTDKAKEFLQLALEVNPDSAISLNVLSRIYEKEENYGQELTLLRRLETIWEEDHDILNRLGNGYLDLKKYDEAIKYYEKSLSIVGEEEFTHYGELASCYKEIGGHDKAIYYFNKYFNGDHRHKEDVTYIVNFALVYYNIGRKDEENDGLKNALGVYKLARDLLDDAHKEYFDLRYDEKEMKKEDQAYFKMAFAIRDNLRYGIQEEEKKQLARKSEVSYAVKHNDSLEDREAKLKYFTENPALDDYYNAFIQLFDTILVNSFVEVRGRCQMKTIPGIGQGFNIIKQAASAVPGASLILDITQKAIETAYDIHNENQAKTFLSNIRNIKEGIEIAEAIALKVTMVKAEEILALRADEPTPFLKALYKLKDKAIVSLKDTPQKILAYKDAAILISLCQNGLIDKTDSSIADTLISTLLNNNNRIDLDNESMLKQINSKTPCIIMAVPEIEYDNWVLNHPEILQDAYKAGGSKLVDSLITAFQPISHIENDMAIIGETL